MSARTKPSVEGLPLRWPRTGDPMHVVTLYEPGYDFPQSRSVITVEQGHLEDYNIVCASVPDARKLYKRLGEAIAEAEKRGLK